MKLNDPSHAALREANGLGHEGRARGSDHAKLRLWLRMLSCTTHVENEIRRRLRARFDITLPRFDYMAQLYRQRDGMKMRELSRYLMVTGGNVTSLTDDLEHDGLVVREGSPTDRRAWIVRLTPQGRATFEAMAREHEEWIVELFAGLDDAAVPALYDQLGKLRVHLVMNQPVAAGPPQGDDAPLGGRRQRRLGGQQNGDKT
jgi:DNA-binding MarR family transcriptional regulator